MTQISIEQAKLSDALRLSILLKTVYIQTYATEGITFEFSNFITKRFSVEHIETIIKKSPGQLLVACLNGNPVGISETLYDTNCPIRHIAVPELSKLYVLERFYDKGVGYKLLKATENAVIKNGGNQLNLEVYINNTRAITFYKRQGYNSIGNVDFPMEFNTYENLVMNKVLN